MNHPLDQFKNQKSSISHNPEKFERMLVFVIAISFIAFVVGLYFGWKPLVYKIAESIPYSIEKQISEKIADKFAKEQTEVSKQKVLALEELYQYLKPHIAEEFRDMRFHVAPDLNPNAFATPGGQIIFTEGFLKQALTPEEILGVMAHELSHVTHRHVFKNLLHTGGVFLLVDFFFGGLTGFITVLADNGATLMSRNYSREFEDQSDASAWDIMMPAKINPQGMVDFFERLEKQSKAQYIDKNINKVLNIYSTHPDTNDRIKKLKERIQSLPKTHQFNKIDFDMNRLKG